MKARTMMLLLLVLAILVPAAVLVADTDSRTIGQKVDDALLGTKVKASLLKGLGADALGIEVEARDGLVTLRGDVDSRSTAEQSEAVARSVEGVRRVRGDVRVEVDTPSGTPVGDAIAHAERELADAVLETRVKNALLRDIGAAAFDVEVEATDGTVSLSGKLDDREHEKLALRAARECDGVEKVIDLLES